MIHESGPDRKDEMVVTKPDAPSQNVTRDLSGVRHETERAVAKRDASELHGVAEEVRRRHGQQHLYQIGDGRAPATAREDAALARWVEIDHRRYIARFGGQPFQFTAAERALKARLFKAGLITNKRQGKMDRRAHRADQRSFALAVAKVEVANGYPGGIQRLQDLKDQRAQETWAKKWRALQKTPVDHLLLVLKERATLAQVSATLKDMMEQKGVQRSLVSLWRDFFAGWEAASPDKREALTDDVREHLLPAILERVLMSRGK
jgi:hypothetical protein